MEKKMLVHKRASERISTNIAIRFFYGNMFYSGVVTDLSAKGMYIRTMVGLALGSLFPVVIRKEGEVLIELARVKHLAKTSDDHDGMGVEIINPSRDFLKFTNGSKSV